MTVFSYLDDFSLWCVSKVCTRWEQLLRSHIPQTWRRLVDSCWPLYEPLRPVDDWHFAISALLVPLIVFIFIYFKIFNEYSIFSKDW